MARSPASTSGATATADPGEIAIRGTSAWLPANARTRVMAVARARRHRRETSHLSDRPSDGASGGLGATLVVPVLTLFICLAVVDSSVAAVLHATRDGVPSVPRSGVDGAARGEQRQPAVLAAG